MRAFTGQRAAKLVDPNPSYYLRYRVYCLERGLLPAEIYPDRREIDEFDTTAVHIGVIQLDRLLASFRLIQGSLPCGRYWPISPCAGCAEVSRWVIDSGARRPIVSARLYRALFDQAAEMGLHSLMFAIEPAFARMLGRRYRIEQIGGPRAMMGPPVSLYQMEPEGQWH